MSRRRLTPWITIALRVVGALLVVGFLGGVVLAAERSVDPTVQVQAPEVVEDLEPDSVVVTAVAELDLVRDPRDCRATGARRSSSAPAIAPSVPPPRA